MAPVEHWQSYQYVDFLPNVGNQVIYDRIGVSHQVREDHRALFNYEVGLLHHFLDASQISPPDRGRVKPLRIPTRPNIGQSLITSSPTYLWSCIGLNGLQQDCCSASPVNLWSVRLPLSGLYHFDFLCVLGWIARRCKLSYPNRYECGQNHCS